MVRMPSNGEFRILRVAALWAIIFAVSIYIIRLQAESWITDIGKIQIIESSLDSHIKLSAEQRAEIYRQLQHNDEDRARLELKVDTLLIKFGIDPDSVKREPSR